MLAVFATLLPVPQKTGFLLPPGLGLLLPALGEGLGAGRGPTRRLVEASRSEIRYTRVVPGTKERLVASGLRKWRNWQTHQT